MSNPTFTLKVAFVNNLTDPDPLTWVDLTSRMKSFETSIGREDETKPFDVGQMVVTLDNRDRALDRANTTSPYYPNVQPRKRIKLQAAYGAIVAQDLFTGFVEDWPFGATTPGKLEVQVRANDLLSVLAATNFTAPALSVNSDGSPGPVRLAESCAARITWLCDQAGVRADDRGTFDSKSRVGDLAYADTYNVLEQMRAVEQAEGGYLWVEPTGKLFFRFREWRVVTGTFTPAITFGDGPGEYPPDADSIERESGADRIFNHALVKRPRAGDVYEVEDTASEAAYGDRTWPGGGGAWSSQNESDAEAESRGALVVARYSQPLERITGLTFSGAWRPDLLWPLAVAPGALNLAALVQVNARYGGIGAAIGQASYLERIRWSGDTESVRYTLGLSPIPADSLVAGGYWLLGAGGSQLGTNTRLSF